MWPSRQNLVNNNTVYLTEKRLRRPYALSRDRGNKDAPRPGSKGKAKDVTSCKAPANKFRSQQVLYGE